MHFFFKKHTHPYPKILQVKELPTLHYTSWSQNQILSIVTEVGCLWSSFTIQFPGNVIGCRQNDVVRCKEFCKKRLCLNYIQMLQRRCLTAHKMGNLQHTSHRFSFVDVTLWADMSFDIHSAMGDRKVPRSRRCSSHAGCSVLIVQCMETFLYVYSSRKFWCAFFWRDLSPGS